MLNENMVVMLNMNYPAAKDNGVFPCDLMYNKTAAEIEEVKVREMYYEAQSRVVE